MAPKDFEKIVTLQIEENFERENQFVLEIERHQNTEFLQKRADIRNQMRSWWKKVLGIQSVEARDIGQDHRDLVFLRMAKWWAVEEETGVEPDINKQRLRDWIKAVPKGLYVFEEAKFEEKVWRTAEEIFEAGLNRLDGNTIGLWKIYFKDNLEATYYNFGDVIDFKLKVLEKEIDQYEQISTSLKQKIIFRVKELLAIKIAKLFESRNAVVTDDNFSKVEQIIEGALNNKISIGLILKFLEHADEEFPNGLPKEKQITSIMRWMKNKILYKNDINAVLIVADQLMRFKMIEKEELQQDLKDSLEKRIRLMAEKVSISLNGPEDLAKLIVMPSDLLGLYHRNINTRNSMTGESYNEVDLNENFKSWCSQFDAIVALAMLIGLVKVEPGDEEIGG